MNIRLTRDDEARAQFVIALKNAVNLGMAADIRTAFDDRIMPGLEAALGHKLSDLSRTDRDAVHDALVEEPLYRNWSSLTYMSQTLMWDTVASFVDRQVPTLQATADTLAARPEKLGSLALDPDLDVPWNIADVEVHRQPGGFCFEKHDHDIEAGARYNGGGLIYAAGKGRNALAGKSGGDFVRGLIAERWPDFRPLRILEVGCGTGRNTMSYARLYPEAEVHGVDCAAPLLRWAHATAEAQGLTIHFRQMDAALMTYPDESFDLIVSHILGHEMTEEGLPAMIAECWRLLRPGGIAVHIDVPIQPGQIGLVDQVLNDWQVQHNNERSWRLWAEADVPGYLEEAGFPVNTSFAGPVAQGAKDVWYVYGGRKPEKAA
ncbi:class I SAM-dependent methyltransferase [Sphingomonas crocodyli]|nr:class I SAM-dependent methyltransferase [Sphingomonas crocodyli]